MKITINLPNTERERSIFEIIRKKRNIKTNGKQPRASTASEKLPNRTFGSQQLQREFESWMSLKDGV